MPRGSKKALGQILPGLWIGRMAAVREIFHMQESSTQQEEWTVVSMISSESMIRQIRESLEDAQTEFSRKYGRELVKRHEVWDLPDKSDAPFVSTRLSRVLEFISNSIDKAEVTSTDGGHDRPKRNCLVHCARGVSRSAAVCAAWLISCKGYSLPNAMDKLGEVRHVCPNLGFLAGLRAIDKCCGDIIQAENRLSRKQKKQSLNSNNIENQQAREGVGKAKHKDESKVEPTTNKENNKSEKLQTKKKKEEKPYKTPPVHAPQTNERVDEKRIVVDVGNETNLSELLERENDGKKGPRFGDEVSC